MGTEEHKLLALRTLITAGSFTPPVLIFVQSILRSKELAAELLFDKINADCIHADRTAEERDAVVEGFESGKIWCLICTDVMGRGVDFKGVKLVVNYDFPQSGGSYIHRIGELIDHHFYLIGMPTDDEVDMIRSNGKSWESRKGNHVLH